MRNWIHPCIWYMLPIINEAPSDTLHSWAIVGSAVLHPNEVEDEVYNIYNKFYQNKSDAEMDYFGSVYACQWITSPLSLVFQDSHAIIIKNCKEQLSFYSTIYKFIINNTQCILCTSRYSQQYELSKRVKYFLQSFKSGH
jgi:hypothetical protein